MISKHNLKHVTGEWYLYHHIKNENAMLPVIVGSFLTLFLKGGGPIMSIGIWVWYSLYCHSNNEILNNDPEILKERELWMKSYIEKGDVEEYKRVLGIRQ